MKGWYGQPTRHLLASKGIKTSFDEKKKLDDDLDLIEKMDRMTSYRNYHPDEFFEYVFIDENTISREKYVEARRAYVRMESGRFRDMMDGIVNFFGNLDPDEKSVVFDGNPELMKWLGIHGFLLGDKTFEDWTGIPSYTEFDMVKESDKK